MYKQIVIKGFNENKILKMLWLKSSWEKKSEVVFDNIKLEK